MTASKTTPGGESSSLVMVVEEDVLKLRITGEVSGSEMQVVLDKGEELYARHGYILLLVDARQLSGMHADARKLQAERVKRYIRPSHTAMYHVNPVMRVMSTLVQRGVELVTGNRFPISFHKGEVEARAEIVRQRAVLQQGAGRGRGGA